MMTRTTRFSSAIAAALMLALAPMAGATAAKGADSGQRDQQGAADAGADQAGQQAGAKAGKPVTDAQLEKFAAAYGKLQKVRRTYGRKMKQTQDKAERKKLRKEGTQKMVEAIRGEGLKVAEYQRIGRKLNKDKELRSRLQSMLQQNSGGQGGNGGQTGGSG